MSFPLLGRAHRAVLLKFKRGTTDFELKGLEGLVFIRGLLLVVLMCGFLTLVWTLSVLVLRNFKVGLGSTFCLVGCGFIEHAADILHVPQDKMEFQVLARDSSDFRKIKVLVVKSRWGPFDSGSTSALTLGAESRPQSYEHRYTTPN